MHLDSSGYSRKNIDDSDDSIATDVQISRDPGFILRNLGDLLDVGEHVPEEKEIYFGYSHARAIIGAQALFYAGCCLELVKEQKLVRARKEVVLGLIGCGNMGSFIIEKLLEAGWTPDIMAISTREPSKAQRYINMGFHFFEDPRDLVKIVRILIISVAPQHFVTLSTQIRGWIRPYVIVLSVMAGVTPAKLSQALDLKMTIRTHIDIHLTETEMEENLKSRAVVVQMDQESFEVGARHMCAKGIEEGILHFFQYLENCCVFLRISKKKIRRLVMNIVFGKDGDKQEKPESATNRTNQHGSRTSDATSDEMNSPQRDAVSPQKEGFGPPRQDSREWSPQQKSFKETSNAIGRQESEESHMTPQRPETGQTEGRPSSSASSGRKIRHQTTTSPVKTMKKLQVNRRLNRYESSDSNYSTGFNTQRQSEVTSTARSSDGSGIEKKKKKIYFDCANSAALATHREYVAPVFHRIISQKIPVSKMPGVHDSMVHLPSFKDHQDEDEAPSVLELLASTRSERDSDKSSTGGGRLHALTYQASGGESFDENIVTIVEDPVAESLRTTPHHTSRSKGVMFFEDKSQSLHEKAFRALQSDIASPI